MKEAYSKYEDDEVIYLSDDQNCRILITCDGNIRMAKVEKHEKKL